MTSEYLLPLDASHLGTDPNFNIGDQPLPIRYGMGMAILNRHHPEYQGDINDIIKVVLAIEGGGYSGVVSAGMLTVMEQVGFIDICYGMLGTSTGALNASGAAGGQAAKGARNYVNLLQHSKEFYNLWRATAGRSPVNLGVLLCGIITNKNPFNFERIKNGPGPKLGIIAVNVPERRAEVFSDFVDVQDLMMAARKSCSVPLLTGKSIENYSDGGLLEPTPIYSAQEFNGGVGQTLVIALRNCGKDLRKEKDHKALIELIRRHPHGGIDLAELSAGRVDVYNTIADQLQDNEFPNVTQIALDGSIRPADRIENSLERVILAFKLGVFAAGKALGLPPLDVTWDKKGIPSIWVKTNNSKEQPSYKPS